MAATQAHAFAAHPRLRQVLPSLVPTRWALLALTCVLALRVLGWAAQRVWLPELPPLRSFAKGIAWDIALVGTLVAWSRWLSLWRPERRSLVGLGRDALLVGAVVVRWLDAGHCFMARAHWTADAFLYLDAGFLGSLADPRLLAAVLAMGATAVLVVLSVRRDVAVWSRQPPPAWAALTVAMLCVPAAAWALRDGIAFPPTVDRPRLTPEVNFVRQALVAWSTTPQLGAPPELSPERRARFAQLGLVPPTVDLAADWPLLSSRLPTQPFPFPRRPVAPDAGPPNVVVTLMESTNRLFVHGLSGRYPGLMPHTSALAGRMMAVSDFYNTSAPTIAAMVTALCGIHPPAHPHDLQDNQRVDGAMAYTCVGDLLGNHGYRTVFLQGATKNITHKEDFLLSHGFDEVHGYEEVVPQLPFGHPPGPWGAHDTDLADYAAKTIERLEAQRARDGRPYLLVMLTLDSHEPGMAAEDCRFPLGPDGQPAVGDLPASPAARELLRGYHCQDRGIGKLAHTLLDGPRADRTVWLLTADHAAFAGLVPREIYLGSQADSGDSAPVPFLLHDPLHQLPPRLDMVAGTRDLTPTLLDLLGLTGDANSLTGMSIFGPRRNHPFLIGRVGERVAFVHTPQAHVELPLGVIHSRCRSNQPLDPNLYEIFSACDLQAWLEWQDGLWSSRRLFPAALYRGSDRARAPLPPQAAL
ncbi:MAG: LTA synthase family protein [Deltaproteobacteria bacterium]|nr:LTA synthase family protein [Deltaproteobacteria bacterium]